MATARTLAFLAALCLAVPAGASVLVIQEPLNSASHGNNTQQALEFQALAVKSILRNRGATLRVVPSTAVTTAGAAAGQITTTLGTETHHAVIHLAASLWTVPIVAATYDHRVYLSAATWPTVPHLWVVYPASGGSPTSNTSADTTGCNDNYPSGQALNGSLYTTGHPWAWKSLYSTIKPAIATATRANGYWRALVAYSDTPADRAAVKDADSLTARSINPDSVIVWMRAKSNSAADLAAAQIFVYAGAGGIQDIASLKVALAMLDSVTAINNPGGKVFDNPGRATRRHGLALTAANRHGSPTAYNVTAGGGIYCPSIVAGDTCDRTNFSGGVDSLNTLQDINGNRVKGTWLVDPESLTTTNGALLMAILKRAGAWKFGLQAISGTVASTTTRAGAAGRSIDPFGMSRRRSIFPTTPSLTPSCATDSGSVQCNVSNGFSLLAASVGDGRVDHVIAGSEWDWSPQEWTSRAAGTVSAGVLSGGEDSLRVALYSAGVRAMLYSPTADNANVGMSYASSGSVTGGADPAGWSPTQRMLNVRWGGSVIGQIALLGARWEPTTTIWTWQQGSHPGIAHEWLAGDEMGKYYLADAGVYYHHTFQSGTRVFATQAGMLGGPRGDPWPQRPGWWQIKGLQHGFNAAHAHLPRWADGTRKILDEFDYIENLRP